MFTKQTMLFWPWNCWGISEDKSIASMSWSQ